MHSRRVDVGAARDAFAVADTEEGCKADGARVLDETTIGRLLNTKVCLHPVPHCASV